MGDDSQQAGAQVMASLEGKVVKGFGRGSKELGIPTANFPEDVVEGLPESMTQGIYYGWAQYQPR
ncbi:hypothetical protein PTSG_13009 [Salpingoeca rosetta]|uniref:riboflavin kinase n=1 Tax=Salpingoeca rosetta (strain ATCC 50818 / BSB-021) TaxID=946362 RepID=F2UQR8_SALR5|nr:uncharacterized protein PTSG_13009 [Salpingoeca rosetta]EGD79973.1 hypothetical protein PTSG_13009 [Salpingoeca rosetta]|eukprot:XP_004988594.1 hypothetical protein PTSG_13009 [Salpingoeca rosetta]